MEYFNKMKGGKRAPPRAPLIEIFWSSLGGLVSIAAIYLLGQMQGLYLENNLFLIGSFGASAVLLYATPVSPYAQPRNLMLGHMVSAVVGVSCFLLLKNNMVFATALAVSLAIVFMHLFRCIHPPGGATALIAVIGGEQIHHLGYWYVLTPVGLGSLVMLVVALLVNNLSKGRRYPQYW